MNILFSMERKTKQSPTNRAFGVGFPSLAFSASLPFAKASLHKLVSMGGDSQSDLTETHTLFPSRYAGNLSHHPSSSVPL